MSERTKEIGKVGRREKREGNTISNERRVMEKGEREAETRTTFSDGKREREKHEEKR